MQNLPHVNAQASSQSERANSSNSTANPYDRLSPNAESFERRFSSVLASLKTRLGDFADKKRSDTFKQSMQDSQKLAQEHSDQARELRDQKEEQEEQDRKLRAQREAAQDRAEQAQALKVLAQQAQAQATHEQQQAQQAQQAQQNLQAQQEASNRELRPSEILAAAYAAQSGAAATASGASTTASGAATSIASGAATTAASGAATLSLSAANTLSSGSTTNTNTFAAAGSASGAGAGTGIGTGTGSGAQGLASYASGGAANTTTTTTTTTTTVANATVASGAATTTTTDGSVSGSGVTSIAGQTDAASGNGSGSGNGAGNGNAALSATNAAYGADDVAPNAQAAAQMLQVDGVETTDRAISSSLNALNQHQLGNMDSQEQKVTTAQQIAQLNREELKESLDVMARKANVSKLSLQMANPAALAQARRDAQMLAGLPTSQDSIAALDVSRLNLMAAQGNGSNLAAMAGVVTGNSQSVSQVTALNSGPVETVGRTSTEILMQQHQLQQETHGVVEKQALTAAGRAQQAAQQLQAQVANNASTSATTNSATAAQSHTQAAAQTNAATLAQAATMAANTTPAAAANAAFAPVPQNMAAQVAATSAAMQSLGADRARAEGGLTQANAATATAAKSEKSAAAAENGHFGKAAEALLRLAAQQNADGRFDDATTKLMANTIEENQLLGEVADSEVRSALESLQQNARGQNGAGAAVGYQNSRLASIMTEGAIREQDLAAAAAGINAQSSSSQRLARGAGADDANNVSAAATLNGEAQGAQLSAAAQAQVAAEQAEAAQVREQAQQELQADISRGFILSSDPSSNAAMIHERVMQMAARNLKHLAVDMEPEGLGKMRVNIDLNDKNDALSVWVAAADPQTRALLRHTLPVLQSSLAQQDIVTQTQVLDLNEIEAEEHAEAAVRASAVAQKRLAAQGGNTAATTEVAAAETTTAQPQRGNAMMSRWSNVHSTTDGQGRLRGV